MSMAESLSFHAVVEGNSLPPFNREARASWRDTHPSQCHAMSPRGFFIGFGGRSADREGHGATGRNENDARSGFNVHRTLLGRGVEGIQYSREAVSNPGDLTARVNFCAA